MKYLKFINEGVNQDTALNILKRINKEEDIDNLLDIDNSKNNKNLPMIAYFYISGIEDRETLGSVFDKVIKLENKKALKMLQYTKKGVKANNKLYTNFIDFSELIDGMYTSLFSEKTEKKNKEVKGLEPIFSNDNVDIYLADTPQKSVILGKQYTFCIAQPSNTMWLHYRMQKESTFYYIFDKTREDSLRTVVYDCTRNGVELTDVNNTTNKISTLTGNGTMSNNKAVKEYNNYLVKSGVDLNILKNKPLTPKEREENNLVSKKVNDNTFIKMPLDIKEKYISMGHNLTTKQLEIISVNKNLLHGYLSSGNFIEEDYYKTLNNSLKKTYIKARKILLENGRRIQLWEICELSEFSKDDSYMIKYIEDIKLTKKEVEKTSDNFKKLYAEYVKNTNDKKFELWQIKIASEILNEPEFYTKEVESKGVFLKGSFSEITEYPKEIQLKFAKSSEKKVVVDPTNIIPLVKLLELDIKKLWDVLNSDMSSADEKWAYEHYEYYLSEDEKKVFLKHVSDRYCRIYRYNDWLISEFEKYNIPINVNSGNVEIIVNNLKNKNLISGYKEVGSLGSNKLDKIFKIFDDLDKEDIFIKNSSDSTLKYLNLYKGDIPVEEIKQLILEEGDFDNNLIKEHLPNDSIKFKFILDNDIYFDETLIFDDFLGEYFEDCSYYNESYIEVNDPMSDIYDYGERKEFFDKYEFDNNFEYGISEAEYHSNLLDFYKNFMNDINNENVSELNLNEDLLRELKDIIEDYFNDVMDSEKRLVESVFDYDFPKINLFRLKEYSNLLYINSNSNFIEFLDNEFITLKYKPLREHFENEGLFEDTFFDYVYNRNYNMDVFTEDESLQSAIEDIIENNKDHISEAKEEYFSVLAEEIGFTEMEGIYKISAKGVIVTFTMDDIEIEEEFDPEYDEISEIDYKITISKTYNKQGKDITKKVKLSDIKKAINHLNPELFEKNIVKFNDFRKLF